MLFFVHCTNFFSGYCAYLDAENALDASFVESMGVNTDNLLISPPDSAERLLSVVDTLTKSGSIDVIVVDSVSFIFMNTHSLTHICLLARLS